LWRQDTSNCKRFHLANAYDISCDRHCGTLGRVYRQACIYASEGLSTLTMVLFL
jgi:hypothetical protein